MDDPEIGTYHGMPVEVIDGHEVVQVPDHGFKRCNRLCCFYTGMDCTQQARSYELKCGDGQTFYIKANDAARDEYVAKVVALRLEGLLPEPQPLPFQEKD